MPGNHVSKCQIKIFREKNFKNVTDAAGQGSGGRKEDYKRGRRRQSLDSLAVTAYRSVLNGPRRRLIESPPLNFAECAGQSLACPL